MIISGQLISNKAFPNENELCKQLNVSRGTLREAYKILEIQGYISSTRHGIYVKEKDDVAINGSFNASLELSQYNNLIEFLIILETKAAYLAVQRATEEQLKEIEHYMHQCDINHHISGVIEELNYQFHLKIRMASNNKLIVSALSAAYEQFNQKIIRKLIIDDADEFIDQCIEQHKQLFHAIKNGKADEAKKIAYEHLLSDVKQLTKNTVFSS